MFPTRIKIVEVGPRDGLQMEKTFIPTETKVAMVNALARAGVGKMEATSFVSPRVIPQLRDAEELFQRIERLPGVQYLALVPNRKGAERALAAGADGVKIVICVSDSYNRRNVGMAVEESFAVCGDVRELATSRGKAAEVVIGLSFGCPLEGPTEPGRVAQMTERLAKQGFVEVSIADSMGVANPLQVRRLMRRLQDEFPQLHFSLHLHNTRGLALANALAALEEGIDEFDCSFGGLGGSEVVVRGAGGNLATEDFLNMAHEMGIETGVSLEGVRNVSRMAEQVLARDLDGYVYTVGTPEEFYARCRETAPSGKSSERA
jgi:hydroxymethylglutaryl-CoA lyase